MKDNFPISAEKILNYLRDGIFICDGDYRIVYWNQSAEHITGWQSGDVVGCDCFDEIFAHEDEAGTRLAAEASPLFRAMVSGVNSKLPVMVLAHSKNGDRIPMQVTTTPINKELVRLLSGITTFAAVVCGIIDTHAGTLRFVGAGSPPPLIIHPDWTIDTPESLDMLFGVEADSQYTDHTIKLKTNDSIFFVSDGAVEIRNAKEELLGVDGFAQIIKALNYPHTELDMHKLHAELLKFSNDARLQDDITIMEIRYLG